MQSESAIVPVKDSLDTRDSFKKTFLPYSFELESAKNAEVQLLRHRAFYMTAISTHSIYTHISYSFYVIMYIQKSKNLFLGFNGIFPPF